MILFAGQPLARASVASPRQRTRSLPLAAASRGLPDKSPKKMQ